MQVRTLPRGFLHGLPGEQLPIPPPSPKYKAAIAREVVVPGPAVPIDGPIAAVDPNVAEPVVDPNAAEPVAGPNAAEAPVAGPNAAEAPIAPNAALPNAAEAPIAPIAPEPLPPIAPEPLPPMSNDFKMLMPAPLLHAYERMSAEEQLDLLRTRIVAASDEGNFTRARIYAIEGVRVQGMMHEDDDHYVKPEPQP